MEQLALREMLQSDTVLSGLRKICDYEQRLADESCRNEALGQARVALTAQYAARARVFAELLSIIKSRSVELSGRVRE